MIVLLLLLLLLMLVAFILLRFEFVELDDVADDDEKRFMISETPLDETEPFEEETRVELEL